MRLVLCLALAALFVAAATAETCPNGSSCPSGSTCCATSSGGYGCCPVQNATCCSDHVHCCPPQYPVCHVSQGTCGTSMDLGARMVPMLKKTPTTPAPKPKPTDAADETCPNGSSCPSGSTCCATSSGGYGCCPVQNATCCSDHVHCCPPQYPVCHVSQGTCGTSVDLSVAKTVPLLKKMPSKPAPKPADAAEETCPNGSSCPSGSTCCATSSGGYGCCPVQNATCCSDHVHCCPPQYPVCHVSQGTCGTSVDLSVAKTVPLLKKMPSKPAPKPTKPEPSDAAEETCPNGSSCPSGSTCCATSSGGYGCCPVQNATCCSDHVHCCPPQYPVCHVSQGTCGTSVNLAQAKTVPLLKKMPAKPAPMVSCPNGSSCPSGSTCCATSSGGYGCCPVQNATCCSDHVHCCPPQYPVCHVSEGTCGTSMGKRFTPMLKKIEALFLE